MPQPNPNNPYHCDRPMRRNGKTKAGAQSYRCSCGYTYTDSDHSQGRQPIGDQPMTQAELDKRYREAHPQKYREIHRKKRAKENKLDCDRIE